MLICMKCHIEYEEGTDFCSQCGGPLATQEKPAAEGADSTKTEEKKPDGRLICPSCRILYERMKTCIRCGAPLVKQSEWQEKEEAKPSQAPESKKEEPPKEPPQVQPPRKEPAETKREKPEPSWLPEMEEEIPSIEAVEKHPAKKLPEDTGEGFRLPQKSLKSFFRSTLGVLSIVLVVVAAIYFVWSQYFHFTTKTSGTGVPASGEVGTPPSSTVPASPGKEPQEKETPPPSKEASPGVPIASIPVVSLDQEVAKIKDTLENIRQANLRKDIDLFMLCYSADYKDRDGRKKAILESWAKFNFLELSYILKVNSVSINSSAARVEWRMWIIPKAGGKSEQVKTVLDVIFQKENNEWKIREVTPVS